MMTPDQVKKVTEVFRKFADSDLQQKEWSEIDDYMVYLDYLEDNQLILEATVIHYSHSLGKVGCGIDHPNECFMPSVVEAVGSILILYSETGQLHKNNRYILEYYLTIDHMDLIVVEK